LLGAGVKRAGEEIAERAPEALDDFANNRIMKAAGFERGSIKRYSPEMQEQIANNIFDKKLLEGPKGEFADRVGALEKDSGKRIGDLNKNIDSFLVEKPELLAEHGINPTELAGKLKQELGTGMNLDAPIFAQENHVINQIVDSVAAFGDKPVNASKAQEIVSMMNKYSDAYKFNAAEPNTLNQIRKASRGMIRGEIDKFLNNLAPEMDQDLFAQSIKARQDFQLAKQLEKPLANTANKAAGNRFFGAGDTLLAAGSIPAIAASVHPVLGAAKLAGGILVKRWLESEGLAKVATGLKRIAREDPDSIGHMLGFNANQRLTKTLSLIKPMLEGVPARVSVKGAQNVMASLLGDKAKGLSSDQQWTAVNDKLNSLANTSQLVDHTAALAAPIQNASDALGTAYQQKNIDAIAYLQSQLPKNPNPVSVPFQSQTWKPTKEQKKEFLDKASVVQHPFSVLDHYKNDTLNQHHMQALTAVYPKIHAEIVAEINKVGNSPDGPKLSFEKRLRVSLLTGANLDPSLDPSTAKQLQSMYVASANDGGAEGQDQKPSPAARHKVDLPGSHGKDDEEAA
jgi:hypothetical protein